MVDHNASTGRDVKHCPFEEELSEVYGYRKNVNPVASCSAEEIPTAGNSSTDSDGSLHSWNSISPVPRPRKSTMVDESDGELDEELLAAEARKGKRRIRRLIQEEDEYLVHSGICESAEMEDPTEHVGDHREKEASAHGKKKKKENSKGEWSKRSGQILEKLGGRQKERGHSEGESFPAKARWKNAEAGQTPRCFLFMVVSALCFSWSQVFFPSLIFESASGFSFFLCTAPCVALKASFSCNSTVNLFTAMFWLLSNRPNKINVKFSCTHLQYVFQSWPSAVCVFSCIGNRLFTKTHAEHINLQHLYNINGFYMYHCQT